MPLPPKNHSPAFSILAKPSGAACNLACEYCFYLDKEQLYPGSIMRMTEDVLNAYIEQLLASQPAGEASVAWQGGEPTLMGLEFFERSVKLVEKYKRPNQQVSYSLQTNGTRLDDEWCAFFKRNDFLIGLSCDGPAELHNAYRVDKGGKGSFDKVKHGWDLLQKHMVETNILCAVHAVNSLQALKVYRFFRDHLQAKFIQFIPVVECSFPGTLLHEGREGKKNQRELQLLDSEEGTKVSERSVRPKQYGRFLIDIFDEWVRGDVGTVFVQIFDSTLASWCGLPASVCVFQETCGRALVMEHNGDLYSCDHFVNDDHLLGNILKKPMIELVNSASQRQFGTDKRERLPATCRACDVRFACQGECPRNRFTTSKSDKDRRLNYLCEGYQLYFRHVDRPMRKMAELLRLGRAPAEIMLKG